MKLPSIFDSGIAFILYAFLVFIVGTGLWQFVKSRYLLKEGEEIHLRSLIPLGGAAAAFGFIGLYKQWSDAFEAIELAGDISPSIVAAAMSAGVSYPALGFLILAISCVFRFVNQ
jgi:hypothetical protein